MEERRTWKVIGLLIIVSLLCLCSIIGVIFFMMFRGGEKPPEVTVAPARDVSVLTVAYSPEKETLFTALVEMFNARDLTSSDGESLTVRAVSMSPDKMIEGAVAGEFMAMSPDSSIWLDDIDRVWYELSGSDAPLVGEAHRYAVTPVTIAMWEDVARAMGYPDKKIGWADILERAKADGDFKWSHPSTVSASGLLATLAEFYAGAGKTRDLTMEDVQDDETLAYVSAIEKTVRYYGEGELATIEQVLEKGAAYLDAFVCSEQLVIYHNQQTDAEKLIAIYPAEGTLWQDHPLALLEHPNLTAYQRVVFNEFRDFVKSAEAQKLVLENGYRPADLSIPIDGANSPINAANGVNPAEPQTTLQMPAPSVIAVVQDAWWYTKRHTNVYLVVDTSGSMRGEKLEQAQAALHLFLEQIKGDRERVGLMQFSTGVGLVVPLEELGQNRATVSAEIDALTAGGNTALLDGIARAYNDLQILNDTERINAIVAMTDGIENNSRLSLPQLVETVEVGNETGVPVIVFCIAYGQDADLNMLTVIAEATGGMARYGDEETIRELYKILSTYF